MRLEKWLPVVGYEGYYEVSDAGRVRRIMPGPGSRAGMCLIKSTHPENGYKSVGLSVDGVARSFQVHRLVAMAFCSGNSSERNYACHKNGDPSDNRAENLYWGDARTNGEDCIAHGRKLRWPAHSQSRLTPEQAGYALSLLDNGKSVKNIAKEMGVGYGTIQRLRARVAA